MKISASLIIKNEEEMLPRCLKSIKGLDEIVIVDTGSTDKSVQIAKKAGAKVFTDYKWNDNFAEARNESKKHCTGDWLLIIDGDEILETSVPTIREFLSQPFMRERDAIMFYVNTGKEVNEQIRMFRNRPDVDWVGAAHNLPYIRTQNGYERMSEIQHSTFSIKANFSPNHHVDKDRTLRIMSKEIQKGPQVLGMAMYTRYLYYIAREYMNRRDPFKVVWFLEKYTKIAQPTNEMADAWFLLATCYVDLGDLERGVDACFQALKYLPKFKAPWALLHNLAHESNQNMWEKVFHVANNEGVLFERKDAEVLMKKK
jgi:glycosyltransferase involved in cell wall biosynthesis